MRFISKILICLAACCFPFISCTNQKNPFNANDAIMYEDSLRWTNHNIVGRENIRCYYVYDDAIRAARKYKKPIMVFFTGITCGGSRTMERKVLQKSGIAKKLCTDFIVAHLFADATRIQIPESEQYESSTLGRRVTNLVDKNIDIQSSVYNTNTQPNIFFIDSNKNLLAEKRYSYDPNPEKFEKHLNEVLNKYNHINH